ncbi:aminodeoxychorismate synthase component I [Cerasicoccus arenae]|nr:aminodeoxychorismate synthase component I [Cerasicoccus arenae]MBK1859593.1 aminodeoxychorismate synthase component I [Cerasicoccus arenae]
MARIEPTSLTPEQAFSRLRREPGCCWLDSGIGSSNIQRKSILAAHPYLTIRAWGQRIERITPDCSSFHSGDSLEYLANELKTHTGGNSFEGGGVGHFSYEFGRRLAGQPDHSGRAQRWPDFHFQFYHAVYVFDHETGRAKLHATDDQAGAAALDELRDKLFHPASEPILREGGITSKTFTANRSKADYCTSVEAIREAIAAGEIYQANLAQFFSTPFRGDPTALFSLLRQLNPAPFSAYLQQGDRQILSSSPELFLRVEGDQIVTRPIKGTRPRGSTAEEDQACRSALLASEKERAELLMIVDMERNDLGRIAQYGSVRVNELYHLESYATVHHLIGEVEARLRPNVSLGDILRATFPGGSITGAPKLRAMEIIAQQEPSPRDVFCGAIGWLGFNGDIALNIAIRTITCQEGRADFGVGAGIVWDSQPEAEYEETLHKAKALFTALETHK